MAKFNVRARTIDLLGRQQIASISTAISELFKNAHDAYADVAEIDYFRDDGLFVLRDDGLGMTRTEFEERWLTIGTDSKAGSTAGLSMPNVDQSKDRRPILGEKGIGRLAIALIGRQVLVLTRGRVDGLPDGEITGAYIHWGFFELPGIDLHDIAIPMRSFDTVALPSAAEIREMVDEAVECVEQLRPRIAESERAKLLSDMEKFSVDPASISEYLKSPTLTGDGTGTHFYILPADDIINDDIDIRDDETRATRLERNLIGFTNTMTPGFTPPAIATTFRDHVDEGAPIDRIGGDVFLSADEFLGVDHHIQGQFDAYGQFHGKVGIYQQEPTDYILNWNNTDGRRTRCGPFAFSMAVIQPAQRDSLVDPTAHALIRRKLSRHGGMYVYKDGIRVQPYGGTENDFLDVERRRNLKASTYYYSFRNFIGAIELNSTDNANLIEKAGREGFRDDRAYRQLRSILINFLIQSAADFFSEQGRYADEWIGQRVELNRLEEIRKKRERQSSSRKSRFREQLDRFFALVENGVFETRANEIRLDVAKKISAELDSRKPDESKALGLSLIERDAQAEIEALRKLVVVAKPSGVGLNKELINVWASYQVISQRLEHEIILKTQRDVSSLISQSVEDARLDLSTSLRLNNTIRQHSTETITKIKAVRSQTESTLARLTDAVREVTKSGFRNVSRTVDQVLADLAALKDTEHVSLDFNASREAFENLVTDAFRAESERLEKLEAQLDATVALSTGTSDALLEVTEAFETEVSALRERQELDFELSQIGMALNTINHEFGKTAAALRDGFRRLKSWSNANPELQSLYNDMRVSFDHLDNYLSLFTPLDRRLQRTAVDITGADIFRFLSSLFEQRLKRHDIILTASDDFKKFQINGYRADFYPPFVNLLDNSIHWISNSVKMGGAIELLVDGTDLVIRDNGPGVSAIDVDNIFEMNFSRKLGGRGMGLHISKQVLRRFGYNLGIDDPLVGRGASFRISKIQ